MSKRQKPTTERQLEARRANARRSTGPRTPRGKSQSRRNALKHGLYARSVASPPALFEFGEQGNDYRALLGELLQAHAPADDAERQLVEEIATLRWQRRRNLRAQHALIRTELERQERQPLSPQAAGLSLADAPWEEVREKGLLGAGESAGNFRQALDLLGALRDDVEAGELAAGGGVALFRTLFGCRPTMRQAEILSLYQYFASGQGAVPEDDDLVPEQRVVQSVSRSVASSEESDSHAEDATPSGDSQLSTLNARPAEGASDSEIVSEPDDEGDVPPSGDSQLSTLNAQPAEPDDEADLQDRIFFHDLRLAICEEMLAVTERFERYLAERAPLGPAQRDACLAPRGGTPEWRLGLRQEEVLERQIDRRTRLLLELQRRRQARRAAPPPAPGRRPPQNNAPRNRPPQGRAPASGLAREALRSTGGLRPAPPGLRPGDGREARRPEGLRRPRVPSQPAGPKGLRQPPAGETANSKFRIPDQNSRPRESVSSAEARGGDPEQWKRDSRFRIPEAASQRAWPAGIRGKFGETNRGSP